MNIFLFLSILFMLVVIFSLVILNIFHFIFINSYSRNIRRAYLLRTLCVIDSGILILLISFAVSKVPNIYKAIDSKLQIYETKQYEIIESNDPLYDPVHWVDHSSVIYEDENGVYHSVSGYWKICDVPENEAPYIEVQHKKWFIVKETEYVVHFLEWKEK